MESATIKKDYRHWVIVLDEPGQWVSVAKATIEDRLKSFRVSQPRKGVIGFLSFLITLFIIYLFWSYLSTYLSPTHEIDTATGKKELSLSGFILVIAGISILAIVTNLTVKFFPNLTFLFGKEIERHLNRITFRRNLIWSVVIAFVISLVANFFS